MIGPLVLGSESVNAGQFTTDKPFATAETEGFSFMSYLLGLQVENQLDISLGSQLNQLKQEKSLVENSSLDGKVQDPLVLLFSQQGNSGNSNLSPLLESRELSNNALSIVSESNLLAGNTSHANLIDVSKLQNSESLSVSKSLDSILKDEFFLTGQSSLSKMSSMEALKQFNQVMTTQSEQNQSVKPLIETFQEPLEITHVDFKQDFGKGEKDIQVGLFGVMGNEPMQLDMTGEVDGVSMDEEVEVDSDLLFSMVASPLGESQATFGKARMETIETQTEAIPSQTGKIFQKVEDLALSGGGKMSVTLNPADLGEVSIEVLTKGNLISVELTADQSKTRTMLESSLGDLKLSMQSQDLVVHKLEVSPGKETLGNLDLGLGGFEKQDNQQFHYEEPSQGESSEDGVPTGKTVRRENHWISGVSSRMRDTSNPFAKVGVDLRI